MTNQLSRGASPDSHHRELTRVPIVQDELPPVDLTAGPRPGRSIEVRTGSGAARLFLRETPSAASGECAVALHGLAGSSSNWTDLAELLAVRTSTVALDLPGFGFSPPPDGFDFSRRAHVEVVIGLLEQLDVGPVHLLGNSFGGAVAIELAARRPDLVRSLVLISPAMPDLRPSPRRVSDPRMMLAALPWLGRRARRELAEVGPEERAERLVRLCFADPDAVPAHRVREVIEELRARSDFPWAETALRRTTRLLVRSWITPGCGSLWRLLARVRAPVLVAWGDQDRLVSAWKAPRTAHTAPRGRLLMLPRTGHVAQLERPRLLAGAVLGMADEVRSGRW